MDVLEAPLPSERQLALHPLREDKERQVEAVCVKVLQEHGLAELADEGRTVGKEVRVGPFGRDHVEVKVGGAIGRASSIGAAKERCDHPLICAAGCDKTLHDRPVSLRQLQQDVRIHVTVSPVTVSP